jgi:hypothetical protein
MESPFVNRLFAGLMLIMACFRLAPGAHGTIFISTLAQPQVGVKEGAPYGWLVAFGFVTGSSATMITNAQLLTYDGDSVNHTFTLQIWTDNSGQPGAFYGAFSNTPTAISMGANPTTLVFMNPNGISLAAGTTYWLVASINEADGNAVAGYPITYSSTPDAGSTFTLDQSAGIAISINGGSTWGVGNSYFCYTLSGTVAVPPPPPTLNSLIIVNGTLRMTLNNLTANETNVLQVSTNLLTWTPIQTNVSSGTSLSFTNTINPAIPKQFFRAQVN